MIILFVWVLPVCVLKEKERRQVQSWTGAVVGRIWEEISEGNHDQNIVYEKRCFNENKFKKKKRTSYLQEPAAQLEETVVSTLCLGMNWGADLVVGDFSHGFPSSLGHGGGAPFTYGLAFPCEETGDLRKSSQQAPGFVA